MTSENEWTNKVSPESLEDFIAKSPLLGKALEYAKNAHQGQMRYSGEDYMVHPVSVLEILWKELGIQNPEILAAALLHDTLEDGKEVTLAELEEKFSPMVAFLVDGVSKFRSEDGSWGTDHETLRKVFDRSLINPVVAVLKVCGDRMHNARTLDAVPLEKQAAKAKETLFVYARLAESLGIWTTMKELEDLSFQYTDPDVFKKVKIQVDEDPRLDPLFIAHITSLLKALVKESGIDASIQIRKNGYFRLYTKREKASLAGKSLPDSFKTINDLISFRVVVDESSDRIETLKRCYALLGVIRNHFADIEDESRFDDFIAHPTVHGYKTTHLTINYAIGDVEIAVVPASMEEYNMWGIVSLIREGVEDLSEYTRKLVFTPSGEAKFFTKYATGIDFAYSISPDLGINARVVVIDGKEHPLSTVIPHGSTVEILTHEASQSLPDESWLEYCSPSSAVIIKDQILAHAQEKYFAAGEALASCVLASRGLIDMTDLRKIEGYKATVNKLLHELGCKGLLRNLYIKLGENSISPKMLEEMLNKHGITKEKLKLSTIVLEGFNKPGILAKTTALLAEKNANILVVEASIYDKDVSKFILRFVVDSLDEISTAELEQIIKKDDRFTRVDIFN